MNIKAAKELDMVDFLSRLGHEPSRVSHPDYWYKSPLREEKTASFKVNRKKNLWIDFATNTGGNLVDFGVLYFKCTEKDFLQKISGPGNPLPKAKEWADTATTQDQEADKTIKIISTRRITSLPLISYCRERRIPDVIAAAHLKEAIYEFKGRSYYALAFQNDKGGYELRNKHFKGSSTPKDSTFIDHQSRNLVVFEGFFNFLSYLTMTHKQERPPANYLVLNSAGFFTSKLPFMATHDKVYLFLDNDNTGQNCTLKAVQSDRQKFIDERSLYKGYNDLNDWLIHIGQSRRQTMRPTP